MLLNDESGCVYYLTSDALFVASGYIREEVKVIPSKTPSNSLEEVRDMVPDVGASFARP